MPARTLRSLGEVFSRTPLPNGEAGGVSSRRADVPVPGLRDIGTFGEEFAVNGNVETVGVRISAAILLESATVELRSGPAAFDTLLRSDIVDMCVLAVT